MWFDSLIFIIHLAKECFPFLIKEQTMSMCLTDACTHTHKYVQVRCVSERKSVKEMQCFLDFSAELWQQGNNCWGENDKPTSIKAPFATSVISHFLNISLHIFCCFFLTLPPLCFANKRGKIKSCYSNKQKKYEKENYVILIDKES